LTDPRAYRSNPRPDIERLIAPAGRTILDVGCGEGALASRLKASGAARVAGIELDEAAARIASQRLDVLVKGDISTVALPFERGEFDYMIFADVLEHLPDPDKILERMLPLLKNDGRVIVSVPNMRFLPVLARLVIDRWAYTDAGVRDRTHLRIFTRRSFERMLAERGLVVEQLERNHRLFENQANIGRIGAISTRIVRRTVAPLLLPDLLAYQYIAVARKSPAGTATAGPTADH
jgi:2-polyprenyl-3-methyl-5-hydroxy-6-metoxy-1,4-benzoquinol methylase